MTDDDVRARERDRIISRFPQIDLRGLEVGAGWYPLIEEFCAYAVSHLDSETLKAMGPVSFKEKYGALRAEGHFPADLDDKAEELEERSESVCEVCGGPGRQREGGWIRTLCDEHARD